MTKLDRLFNNKKPVIGMVHLLALPGSYKYDGNLENVYLKAKYDLDELVKGGIDGVIVENFNDVPYTTKNKLVTIIAFTHILTRLKLEYDIPMGINVQFNDYEAEWLIGYCSNIDFIRVEVFAENRVGPNGVMLACGPELMRLKNTYPKDIAILCDIGVKHTFALVDQPIDFTINSLIDSGVDGLICTGLETGKSPSLEEVKNIKSVSKGFPLFVGSGVNKDTVMDYLSICDGVIVGSSLKVNGNVYNPVDYSKVENFIKIKNGK